MTSQSESETDFSMAGHCSRRGLIRSAGLAAAGSVLVPWESLPAAGWSVTKIGGHDYVSAKSISEFYRFKTWRVSGKTVVFRSPTLEMRAKAGSLELFINGVKFILSFSPKQSKGTVLLSRMDLVKLIDPILRPSYISTSTPFRTVVIDAGHGGHDSGARCSLGKEKTFALDTAKRLGRLLKTKGFKVKLTRETDVYLTLGQRVRIANAVSSAVFVSIHYNAGQSRAKGIETFALPPAGTNSTYERSRSSDALNYRGNRRDSENIALATAIHASMLFQLKKIPAWTVLDRGVKRARFAVLRGINKPAVLVEGGFLSNRGESRQIIKSSYRDRVAGAIASALVNYRKALTRR